MPVLGIGVPGGHAPLAHHLADHVGPARHFAVIIHSERPDLAGAMATDAVILKDARDLLRVGHLGLGIRFVNAADQAAHRIDVFRLHALVGQHGIQRRAT